MSESSLSKSVTQPEAGQASTSNDKLDTTTEPQAMPQVHSALTKATVAQHPFDDSEGSDTILRTADNMDFYVYRAILSVASPVFKARFANLPKVTSDDEEKPIMKVPETSKTLYLLLRICYPVDDQFISSPMTIGDVLEAALKYDIKVAAKTLKKTLHKYVTNEPLQVYTVACHLSLEDTASLAAHAWKKTSHNWTDNVTEGAGTLIDLKDTIVGGSYIDEMAKISAGSFFRLTQFVRAGVETSFCEFKDPTSQSDPAPAAAAATTTTEPDKVTEAPPPASASESSTTQPKDSSTKTAPTASTSPFGDIPGTNPFFGTTTNTSAFNTPIGGSFFGSTSAQSKPPTTSATNTSSLGGLFGATTSKAPAAFGTSTTSTSSGSGDKPSLFTAPTSNASLNTPSKPATSTSSPFAAAAFNGASSTTYNWFSPSTSTSSSTKPTTSGATTAPSAKPFSFAAPSSLGSASKSSGASASATSTKSPFSFATTSSTPGAGSHTSSEAPVTKLPFSFAATPTTSSIFGTPPTMASASATAAAVPPTPLNVSSTAPSSSGATSASAAPPTPAAAKSAPAPSPVAEDSSATPTPSPTPSAPAATAPVSPPATPSSSESTSDTEDDVGSVEEKKLEYDPQFDFDDADLEITSSDGAKFKVHYLILRLASATIVENVDVGVGEGNMTLALPESSRTVSILLQGCYPSMTVESGFEMAEMCLALRAAAKYKMSKVVDKLKALLRFTNAADALSAFFTLALNNFAEEATEVACSDVLLFTPLSTLYVPEMEEISAQLYYHLLQHRHGCLSAMYTIGSKYEDKAAMFRSSLQWWSMIRSTRSVDLAMPIVEKQLRHQRDTKVSASCAITLKEIRDESAKLTKEVDRQVAGHDALLTMNLKCFADISLPKWLQYQETRASVKSSASKA